MNIIAGTEKGHKIYAPDNIRPTRAMVREALFSIIDVNNSTFVDLFSGSGAIGLEALSRGAKRVIMVERSRKAIKYIERNLKKLGHDATVISNSVSSALKSLEVEADFVFMDPPYDTDLIERTLDGVRNIISEETIIIAEVPSGKEVNHGNFKIVKEKVYGDSSLVFLKL